MEEETLDELRKKIITSFPNYDVVFSHEANKEPIAYAVNKSMQVGKGAYGVVYKALQIDVSSMTLDATKPLAAKKFKDIDQFKPDEINFFKRYHKMGDYGYLYGDAYILMNYLQGNDLYKLTDNVIPELAGTIKKLNFEQRISLIQAILMFVDLMHHTTPATGRALIHSDLNGYNIRAHIVFDKEKNTYKIVDVYLLDFAFASEVEDAPEKVFDDQTMEGTVYYNPVEVLQEKRGIKSDIYALSPVFMTLLGAVNPFKYKHEIYNGVMGNLVKEEFYKAGYCFDGLFDNLDGTKYDPDILPYVKVFLYKMHCNAIDQRPDTDTVLRFFTTLDNFCKSVSFEENDKKSTYVRAAILALIASGLWVFTCNKTHDDPYKFSFENLALSSHVKFCKDIVKLTGLSSDEVLSDISVEDLSKRMLTEDKLTELFAKHGINPVETKPEPLPTLQVAATLFAPVTEIPSAGQDMPPTSLAPS